MVNSIYNNDGNIQITPMNILRTCTMFIKKYDTIQVDSDSVYRMLQRTNKYPTKQTLSLTLPSQWTSYT